MTDNIALERSIREILFSRKVAVLATRGEEYPHACLVAFALTEDISTLVFVTSLSTRKYANIQESNRVTLLVDTRGNTEEDFHDARAVSIQGRARTAPISGEPFLKSLFLDRHPYLEDFVNSPTCVLVIVTVDSYALVSRFQNVLLLDMTHGPDRQP